MSRFSQKKQQGGFNVFESMVERGSEAIRPVKKEVTGGLSKALENLLVQTPQQFIEELVNVGRPESSNVTDTSFEKLKEEKQKNIKLSRILSKERRMRQEDEIIRNVKTQELRVELQMIQEELFIATKQSSELAESTKIAAMQVIIEPSEYHKGFLENLLKDIRKFSQKLQKASIWMMAANARSSKKGWVGNYKKSGAKYLLSGEHYLTRSAG